MAWWPTTLEDRGARGRPAVWALALLAAGLLIGRAAGGSVPATAWFSVACAAGAVGVLAGGAACRVALGVGVVAFGAGWCAARLFEAPASSVAWRLRGAAEAPMVLVAEGIVRRVEPAPEGMASTLPALPFRESSDRFELAVRAVEVDGRRERASGMLGVRADRLDVRGLRAGEPVRVVGTAWRRYGAMNPGEPAWDLWDRQRDVAGSMRAATVDRLPSDGLGLLDRVRGAWWRWRGTQQARAEALLLGGVGSGREARALLGAIVLGVRDVGTRRTMDMFARQGVGHLLAISGFHVAAMAAVTLVVVRVSGDHGRLEPAIVALAMVGYLVLLPPRASVVRAGVMVLALLAAGAAGRRYDRLNLLAWIGVGMLVWRPLDLWSMGFQLTFGVTAGLMALYRPVLARVAGPEVMVWPRPRRRWWHAALEPGRSLLVASLVAWTVATPIVVFHTGIVSPLGVLATLLLTPLIGACLWLSFAAIGIGLLVPRSSEPVSWVLGRIGGGSVDLVRGLDALPGTSSQLPDVGVAWSVAALAVGVYWLTRGHWRDVRGWLAAGLVVGWLVLRVGPGTALPRAVLVRVDALAVGSGTCMLVRSGGEAMLWDCGSNRAGVGLDLVPDAVRALGAGRVRTAVVTHANYDHFSALPDVVRPLGIRTVLVGPSVADRAAAEGWGMAAACLDALESQGVEVRVLGAGDGFVLGRAEVEIVSPARAFASDNDRSLVAVVSARDDEGAERRVLLTGDIGPAAIEEILSLGVRAEAMEAPHHGSANEAILRLVRAAAPTVVLQSTDLSRAGDERLAPARRGRRWYVTAVDGASWVELRADGSVASGAVGRGQVVDGG